MTTETASNGGLRSRLQAHQRTEPHRHMIFVRLIAGLPIFAIGVMHVFLADAAMRPIVEEMGAPLPAILSPLAVAIEIVAGLSLLAGAWARLGALLAIPVMIAATYSHLVIDVWPNPDEPPLALPIVVALGAAYVLWRGAGRWSLDHRVTSS